MRPPAAELLVWQLLAEITHGLQQRYSRVTSCGVLQGVVCLLLQVSLGEELQVAGLPYPGPEALTLRQLEEFVSKIQQTSGVS